MLNNSMSDVSKEDGFKRKIGDFLASGLIGCGLALGARHNLFKVLQEKAKSRGTALTAAQLADLTQCKSRYVREWVNGMVCSGVVDHTVEDGEDKYWLEEYKAGGLMLANASLLMMAELSCGNLVSDCFPVDGPLGSNIDDYPEFHDYLRRFPIWGADDDIDNLMNWYPELLTLLSSGAKVIEVGSGGAHPTKGLAKRFPQSTFHITDISVQVLNGARLNCDGLANVSYGELDACCVPPFMENLFDLVLVSDVLHDAPFPDKFAAGLLKLLKPGRLLVLLDIDGHERVADNLTHRGVEAASHYLSSLLYCVPTALSTPGAAALGACAGVEKISRILQSNGFSEVENRKVNPINVLFVARK